MADDSHVTKINHFYNGLQEEPPDLKISSLVHVGLLCLLGFRGFHGSVCRRRAYGPEHVTYPAVFDGQDDGQDWLVSELRLAGASSIGEANGMLEQFLPRYNRGFRIPPECPESAYRPLCSHLSLKQVLCFKHRRKVAKDNTVKFQLHTLQLLP